MNKKMSVVAVWQKRSLLAFDAMISCICYLFLVLISKQYNDETTDAVKFSAYYKIMHVCSALLDKWSTI